MRWKRRRDAIQGKLKISILISTSSIHTGATFVCHVFGGVWARHMPCRWSFSKLFISSWRRQRIANIHDSHTHTHIHDYSLVLRTALSRCAHRQQTHINMYRLLANHFQSSFSIAAKYWVTIQAHCMCLRFVCGFRCWHSNETTYKWILQQRTREAEKKMNNDVNPNSGEAYKAT